MKNYILAKVSNIIPYYPNLNEITGSVTASILMMQLEYWFAKKDGNAFFKFTEPCDHPLYKEGDSWIEELNFGKDEFKGAFNRIGKSYTSKGQFSKHEDENVFQGKLYASYYDRQKRLTYYFRNNELVDKKIDSWISSKTEKSVSKKTEKPVSSKIENHTSRNGKNQSLENGKTDLQRQEIPVSTDGKFPFPHISVDYLQETTSVDYLQETTSSSKMEDVVSNKDVIQFFEDNFYLLKKFDLEVISNWCTTYDKALIIEAMKIAKKNNARAPIYIERILMNWEKEGINTQQALETYLSSREKRGNDANNQASTSNHRCGTSGTQDEDDVARAIRKSGQYIEFKDDEQYDY